LVLVNRTVTPTAVSVRRLIIPVAVSLAGIAIVLLLVFGITHQGTSRALDNAIARGETPRAPEANVLLPVLNGGGHSSLASYRGKVVLLNFWASWCPPCQEEAPLLERVQRLMQRHGGTVLGVTYLDASPDSLGFIHQHHLTFPNLRDGTGNFAHAYGTDQLPESFMIDQQGHVLKISRGEITPAWLAEALKAAKI
jgi:cytochrome c biogenesis protein CcmG/thiol:disulfide interchange protein DsbE